MKALPETDGVMAKRCNSAQLLLSTILVCFLPALGLAQDSSLKLHLDFDHISPDGTILDQSGNGSHGVQFNRTNLIQAIDGVFGSQAGFFKYVGYISNDPPHVYRFSQYLGVTNIGAFHYLTNGTISFWAQFGTNGDLGMRVLDTGYTPNYTLDPSLASNSWAIARANDPYLSFTIYKNTGAQDVVRWPNDVVRSGGASPILATTSFHLYTVTFDCPAGIAVSYYDGLPYQTNAFSVPWLRIYGGHRKRWLCVGAMAHAGTPEWGDDRYPNSAFFVGRLDELRIYNRTLSAAEVAALYYGDTSAIFVSATAADASAGEPGTGQGTGTLTFTRTGSLDQTLTANINVSGTAVSGEDYSGIGTSVTFAAGTATATKTVEVIDDAQTETDETVTVTVEPGPGYLVGSPASASVTIQDDDAAVPTEMIVDNASSEVTYQGTWSLSTTTPGYWASNYRHDGKLNKGSLSATFTPNLTAAGIYDVYIWYPSRSDYASNVPVDIAHASGTQTVTVNQTGNGGSWNRLGSFNFNAGTGGYVRVRNAGTSGYVIADAVKFVRSETLLTEITVTATDPGAGEPATGSGGGTFEFRRTGSTESALTVNVAFGGSASAGSDYGALPSTVTFGAGAAAAVASVAVIDDAIAEPQETVVATVQPGTGYVIGSPLSATVTIADDDAPAAVEVVLDNTSSRVTYQGTWNLSTTTPGYWASNYRHDGNSSKGTKVAKFTPDLPATGTYQIYMWYPSRSDYANNVPVDVTHADGTTTLTVDQTVNGGRWNLLGTFNFNAGASGSVSIRNAGTTRFVMADALKWVSTPSPSPAPQPTRMLARAGAKAPQVSIHRGAAGDLVLEWTSTPGIRYRIQSSSDDGQTWTTAHETLGDGAALQQWRVVPAVNSEWFRVEAF